MRVTGCETDDAVVRTCLAVVRAAAEAATPNAISSAIKTCRASMRDLLSSVGDQRRDCAVEPILLLRKCCPGLCHPEIAIERRLTGGLLRKLQAVFCVIA